MPPIFLETLYEIEYVVQKKCLMPNNMQINNKEYREMGENRCLAEKKISISLYLTSYGRIMLFFQQKV